MECTAKVTRKASSPIKVYCLPEERARIAANASAAGMTLSTFLLKVGTHHETRSVLDHERVDELLRMNGDLGRLGGLLKLWLTNDARTAEFGEATIRAVLSKIEDTQLQMKQVMIDVVMPRGQR